MYFVMLSGLIQLIVIIAVCCKILLGSVVIYLPNLDELKIITAPYFKIVDNNNQLIAEYGDYYDTYIELNEIPEYVTFALIDTEDHRFYEHNGLDIRGIIRALIRNITSRRIVQGGSSLSQQLAKNILIRAGYFTPSDRTFKRKVYEIALMFRIERLFTKKQILEYYLNFVYFGNGAYGIEAAAKRFFGKSAKTLNVYEAAKLAGMVQAPSRYTYNTEQAKARAHSVLKNMMKYKHLSQNDYDIAMILEKQNVMRKHKLSRYFTDWIVVEAKKICEKYSKSKSFVVRTTLDNVWQKIAEEESVKIFEELGKKCYAEQVGVIVCDKQGGIRAMIGGIDYGRSQYNHAVLAKRQMGSVFKLFVYLSAFENGFTPEYVLNDMQLDFDGWQPNNADKQFRGDMTLEEAFAKSINTITIQLVDFIGIASVKKMAKRLGIMEHIQHDLSIALGTSNSNLLQLMRAFLIIANDGDDVRPYAIVKIVDNDNGRVLYEHESEEVVGDGESGSEEVVKEVVCDGEESGNDRGKCKLLDQKTIDYIKQLLRACVEYGSGRCGNFHANAMGKTGSSQNDRDKWMIGMNDDCKLVIGVLFSTNERDGMITIPGKPLHVGLWREIGSRLTGKKS